MPGFDEVFFPKPLLPNFLPLDIDGTLLTLNSYGF